MTDWIGLYLEEDIGDGDITSEPLFTGGQLGIANVVVRQRAFVAGTIHVQEIFARLGVETTVLVEDGSWADVGTAVIRVEGSLVAILKAERVALNLLGRMCGIATRTRTLMEALAEHCSGTRIAGTRKTTPGFRQFEKEAIRIAGGDPHRMGLYDAMMVKDNHRDAAGGVTEATRRLKAAHPDKELTIEVEALDDALAAAEAGADWILIDNQSPATGRRWAEACWAIRPDLKVEASGNITPETMMDYGWADRISMGALTHQAVSIDVGLDLEGA